MDFQNRLEYTNLYRQVWFCSCSAIVIAWAVKSVPLHIQIAQTLRDEIRTGSLQAGARLPSEHALSERFGVSRGTIRQARASLRADGTIAGSQGRRLAVNRPQLTQPLTELLSFSAWTESLGKTPTSLVIESGVSTANEECSRMLELPPGAEVFTVTRVRLADCAPLMIERTAFTPSLIEPLSTIDFATSSIYAELDKRGISVTSARHLLSAFAATKIDAHHLGLRPGAPLLRVQRVGYSQSGEPLEWSDDRYRGDQINFAIENSSVVSGVVRRMSKQEN